MMNEEIKSLETTTEVIETLPVEEVKIVEAVETKPYTLRELKAVDLFPVLTILRKIGFKNFTALLQQDSVKEFLTKTKNGEINEIADDSLISMGVVIFEVVDIVIAGIEKCEDDFYKLLSNVSGLPIETIKEFDIAIFTEMIIDLIKSNVDFIKAVSKYIN